MSYKDIIHEVYKEEFDALEKKGLLNNIRSLMKNMNFTAQQAMDALKVSPELRKELLPLI